MKILKCEAFLMSCAMPQPIVLPFYGGERTILKRDAMLIKVTSENGLVGWAPGPAHERAAREIQDVISPFLAGKDPADWASFNFSATLELEKTYYAVEIAVLDLLGKFNGAPISELIGGRKRDQIKLYGSAGMYMSPERFAEEAAAIQSLGFPAYKMRPALGPERDIETVEKMRAATGPDFGLMIDAHSWWRMGSKSFTEEQVIEVANAISNYNPAWLEEPLPPDDHDAYVKLRQSGHVTVASGEHEQEESGFLDLIEKRAVDYVQMDVCCQGGFRMGDRVFKATEEAGLKFAFHSWGNDLEVLAAAHHGICWPEDVVEWLEYPCYSNEGRPGMYPFPIAQEILKEPLSIENGFLRVPDQAGLGIEINKNVIDKYPFIDGPWSFFKLEDPPETVAVTGDHSVKWVDGEK